MEIVLTVFHFTHSRMVQVAPSAASLGTSAALMNSRRMGFDDKGGALCGHSMNSTGTELVNLLDDASAGCPVLLLQQSTASTRACATGTVGLKNSDSTASEPGSTDQC